VTYSDLLGGWPGDGNIDADVQGGCSGEGNIDADPRFCDVVCRDYSDLSIAADSPCLGSGLGGADMGSWTVACDVPQQAIPTVLRVPRDYPTIRRALDAACQRDTVEIEPGTYYEPGIEIPAADIVIRSLDPADSAIVATTVIDGMGLEVVRFAPTPPEIRPALLSVTVQGGGTGITCSASAPLIENCQIVANLGERGGGIFCNYSSPRIANCRIAGNQASYGSGGLYCISSSPTMHACSITSNAVDRDGGGVFCYFDSRPVLTNCIVARNRARDFGGGLRCEHCSPELVNCTIADNSAGRTGGVSCGQSAAPVLTNCIVWWNTPQQIRGGEPIVSYCDVAYGCDGFENISAHPRFAERRGFEYLLAPGSPCIDAGKPLLRDTIHDWWPRWPQFFRNGARSDMGAYGGPGNSAWLSGD